MCPMQVKPSNPNSGWIRKIKVFPDKQEVRVFARRWNLGGWAVLQAQGDWDWSSGRKYPLIQYTYAITS